MIKAIIFDLGGVLFTSTEDLKEKLWAVLRTKSEVSDSSRCGEYQPVPSCARTI